MGCPDMFTGLCPHCGKEFAAQSKLYDNEVLLYKVGAIPKRGPRNLMFRLKHACKNCNGFVTVIVRNGVFVALSTVAPEVVELPGGQTDFYRGEPAPKEPVEA